jgi:hypothetical protein
MEGPEMAFNPRQGGSVITAGEPGGMVDHRFVQNIDPKIRWDYAGINPFLTVMHRLGKAKAEKTIKYEFESRETPPQIIANDAASYAAGATTINFPTNWQLLREGDILANVRSEETIRVNSTPTSQAVSVSRGFSGTSAAAVNASDDWRRLATAVEEWSDVRDLVGSNPTKDWNYIQTVRDPFGASGHAQRIGRAGGMIGPNEMEYLREDRYRDHLLNLEGTIMMGERSLNGTTYTTRGLRPWLTYSGTPAYNLDVSGGFNYGVLDQVMYNLGLYSPNHYWLVLCGSRFAQHVKHWGWEKMETANGLKKIGLFGRRYEATEGRIDIVRHPMFTENGWDDEALFLDLECFDVRGFEGLLNPVVYKGRNGQGLQGNGVDGTIYEYRTTLSLTGRNLHRCGRIHGIPAVTFDGE